jgi:uncharacterized repeat protein (TIGR01451 family)
VRPSLTIVLALCLAALVTASAGAHQAATVCNAETDPATGVTGTGATLNGKLGAGGGLADSSACGTWHFDYGKTTAYGLTTPTMEGSEGPDAPASAPVSGLDPGTTYHFRLHADAGSSNLGADMTFHTTDPPAPPPPPPPQTASLDISNSANPTLANSQLVVTYTIVVTNNGPAGADDVTVRNVVPSGMNFVSSTPSKGSCTGTSTVVCPLGSLADGAKATVSLILKPTDTGVVTDTATVDASNLDSGSHTSASATITVIPVPTGPTNTTTTTTTTTATPPHSTLVVDRSIDGVSIGATERQVEDVLGKPESTLALSFLCGKKAHLARYHSHGALFLVTFDCAGNVVSIETYSPFYKTAGGLGPGSSLADVAALKGFVADFCELGYWDGNAGTKPSDVVTVFTPNGGLVASVLITELRYYTACASGSHEQASAATLTLNHSIGGVSIGMTEKDVVKLLGAPASTLRVTLGGGKLGRSVRYRVHGAPLLIIYDASGKVVSIESYSPYFRTAEGIGPGASLNLVLHLPGFGSDFCELGYWNGTAKTKPSHVITVFTPEGGLVASVLITQLRLYTACAAGSLELPPS